MRDSAIDAGKKQSHCHAGAACRLDRKFGVMSSLKEVVSHAMALHQKGDEDGAAAVFEKLLEAMPNEPLALDYLGVRANKKGDYKKAVTLLRQAVSQPNCRPGARLHLGHALRDSGQLVEATDAYRRYVTDSSDPACAVILADVLFDLDRVQEAEAILRQAVEWKPDYVKVLCLLARACDEREKPTEAEEFRSQALDSEDNSKTARLIKGAAHLDLGDPEEAFAMVEETANSLYGEAFESACSALDLSTLPPLQGKLPSAMGVPLIVASGDPKYVQHFAPGLIRSAAANSQCTDIHIHVVVPDGETAAPALPGDLPAHSLTWENDPSAKRITFATRRFVRAAALMRAMDRPLVLIDIDSLVKKDIATANASLPDFDVAMRYRRDEVMLSQRVSAGFLTLAPNAAAQAFIDAVAAYIMHFEKAGSALWSVDQMALLAARYRFTGEDAVKLVRIADVPERFLDWRRHAADSVLWTSRGAGKALPK